MKVIRVPAGVKNVINLFQRNLLRDLKSHWTWDHFEKDSAQKFTARSSPRDSLHMQPCGVLGTRRIFCQMISLESISCCLPRRKHLFASFHRKFCSFVSRSIKLKLCEIPPRLGISNLLSKWITCKKRISILFLAHPVNSKKMSRSALLCKQRLFSNTKRRTWISSWDLIDDCFPFSMSFNDA